MRTRGERDTSVKTGKYEPEVDRLTDAITAAEKHNVADFKGMSQQEKAKCKDEFAAAKDKKQRAEAALKSKSEI